MPYARRNDSSGGGSRGGSKFGGAPRGRSFSDRGGARAEMHPATCADCGARCEVPFRPNGKKPVLCKNCFDQSNDGGAKFSHRDDRRPSDDRRSESGRSSGNDNVGEQLRSINVKLDTIMKALKDNDFSL